MITCKDGHVMATGRASELLADLVAISAALTEETKICGTVVISAAIKGVDVAIDHMEEKE